MSNILEVTGLLGTEDSMLAHIVLGAIPPLPAMGWVEGVGGLQTIESVGGLQSLEPVGAVATIEGR